MSMADHIDPLQIAPDPATLHAFHRQQLSAMLDGELSPDEAKFMLRRLEHDVELAGCWERWQVCGEVLRGRVDRVLSEDFAARVAVAIQAPLPRASSGLKPLRGRSRLRVWGGVGIAASLALVTAVLVVRLPDNEALTDSTTVVADADVPALQILPETPVAGDTSGGSVQKESPPLAVQSPVAALAIAPEPIERAAHDPLAPAIPVPRPWPRAGIRAGGLTVGYGAPSALPMDPFQPRWTPPPSALWPDPAERPARMSRQD